MIVWLLLCEKSYPLQCSAWTYRCNGAMLTVSESP